MLNSISSFAWTRGGQLLLFFLSFSFFETNLFHSILLYTRSNFTSFRPLTSIRTYIFKYPSRLTYLSARNHHLQGCEGNGKAQLKVKVILSLFWSSQNCQDPFFREKYIHAQPYVSHNWTLKYCIKTMVNSNAYDCFQSHAISCSHIRFSS